MDIHQYIEWKHANKKEKLNELVEKYKKSPDEFTRGRIKELVDMVDELFIMSQQYK